MSRGTSQVQTVWLWIHKIPHVEEIFHDDQKSNKMICKSKVIDFELKYPPLGWKPRELVIRWHICDKAEWNLLVMSEILLFNNYNTFWTQYFKNDVDPPLNVKTRRCDIKHWVF